MNSTRATTVFGLKNAVLFPYQAKALVAAPMRSFALKKPDNEHLLDPEFKAQELKAFEENLTPEQREIIA